MTEFSGWFAGGDEPIAVAVCSRAVQGSEEHEGPIHDLRKMEDHMSAASADFVAKTGAKIVFTFTPQPEGFAFLSGASLTEENTVPNKFTALTVTNNQTTYPLPQGDSFIQVAIVDGPVPENGTLSFKVDGGASTELWSSRPLSRMPGAFFGFGN
jgi:hypothetical protein